MANGKIAMKLEPADSLIGVQTCSEADDVLLATHAGKCIRFPVGDVRVFAGRTSTGVRGIRLDKGDRVISLGMLRHGDFDAATRAAYLKRAAQMRRRPEEDEEGEADHAPDVEAEAVEPGALTDEEFERMAEAEEFILTATENGFGKRTSSYEYRVTGRGGKGIVNIDTAPRNGNVVASFPVGPDDQIMLITNAGQLIRMPLNDVRIASRKTLGVRLFRTSADEAVVSAAHLPASLVEDDDETDDAEANGIDDTSDGSVDHGLDADNGGTDDAGRDE
jgi:DNA gyrase subunit A